MVRVGQQRQMGGGGSRSVKVIKLKTQAGMMQALKIRCKITVPDAGSFIAQDNYY